MTENRHYAHSVPDRKIRASRMPRSSVRRKLHLLAGGSDELFHLCQIFLKGFVPGGREAVLGAGNPAIKELLATDVSSFFQLARMDREIAVTGLENALEIVEG